ncbi:ribbon-helix-helix domain-containing protein [Clostridium sp. BJN0013]|uniref:ribbon-helix-helix domain-containing protein n=1 Tax=Clostridium sp. BJN0013 TaxID=3236840 RepID=UPI0034C61071
MSSINDNDNIKDINSTSNNITDGVMIDDIGEFSCSNTNCNINKQSKDNTITDIKFNILKKVSKRSKYVDTHIRKTYYFDKKLFKKMEKLSKKYNIDNSYIINQALELLFEALEENNKKE